MTNNSNQPQQNKKNQSIKSIVRCAHCGSSEIWLEAVVCWNRKTGKAEIQEICDKGLYCGHCEGYCKIEWIDNSAEN